MLRRLIYTIAVLFLLFPMIAQSEGNTVFIDSFTMGGWHLHFSRHTFSSDNPGDGILSVAKTTLDMDINGGFIFFNRKFVPLRKFLIGDELVFEKEIKLLSNNAITVFMRGTPDASITIEIKDASVPIPPPEVTFTADPLSIMNGESSTLSWTTNNADNVSIDQGIGDVAESGDIIVIPQETVTYTLVAIGPGGNTTESLTVTVSWLPPIVEITADPETIELGQSSTLSWTSDYAEDCVIEPDIGVVDLSGSLDVSPTETTTYTIAASGPEGNATDTVTVIVTAPLPVVDIVANPETIISGESATLTWNSSNADSCIIEPDIGSVDVNGSAIIFPTETTTYTITATGSGGIATSDVTVTVLQLPTVEMTADPAAIIMGEASTLSWTSANADTAIIDNDIGNVAVNGTISVSPSEDTTFTITVTGPGGTATSSVTVVVAYPAPMVDLQASPEVIQEGSSSLLTWSSAYANSCTIAPGIGSVSVSGSIVMEPTETTTYIITATGPGGTVTSSVTITVLPLPTINISASPETILLGESSTLNWSTTNASTCEIDQGIGTVDVSGSISVSPTETTTYTITATGPGGTIASNVTVTVIPLTAVSISASPESILVGESSILTWASENADTCEIDQDVGSVDVNGSVAVSPTETTTYTITATGPGGTTTSSITVTAEIPSSSPTVSISATPMTIAIGESSTLSWTSTNAQSAHIDNGIGIVDINDSITVSPEHTTTYTISVAGFDGNASDQVVVKVTGNPEPQPEGSFGEQYEDLVPPDATIESYDPKRFSVITGIVQGIDSSPIENVSVNIHGHPEYGTAETDADGRFSIPVEGGATNTLVFKKESLITAHRQVYVPWNDIPISETIVMIAEDPVSTTVNFDGNPDTVITHKSTAVVDEFGSRSCSMIFTGDNHAYLVDEDGNDVQELTTITTRATEFTTPESMPAKLPPNSAYTYCAELGVDGAQRVRFEKPVITWVDNFLGFDVGMIVPVGYYDRDRGVWVPSDNGVVVKLLDTDTDGIVDALDANGDDLPDDIDEDGSYSSEVKGLNDPAKYTPGNTFWRVAVSHFTPWDCNWPYVPPPDAEDPPDEEPDTDEKKEEELECDGTSNSFVNLRSRIFHEDIPIPGTDITLHYASNRVEGYKVIISVPASGETVPASLNKIIVKATIAGRFMSRVLAPLPNQKVVFTWDGVDHLGQNVGGTTAHVSVGFVYDAVYTSPGSFPQAFGQAGSVWTGVRARQEVISWKKFEVVIEKQAGKGHFIAEGWTLSNHHYENPIYPSTLYKGDGTKNNKNATIIDTVAGGGIDNGNGGYATEATLVYPWGVALDALGNLYINECNKYRIRKVDTNGIITTVAGNGNQGYRDGSATWAQLRGGQDICIDNYNNLYIADVMNYRIRKVASGSMTTVAGNGNKGYSGDGGPATEAQLDYASGVCVDTSNNLYIADSSNQRIRKVDTNGIITTVAGNGSSGYSGDGGPAIAASLYSPRHVSVDTSGNLYILDTINYRVRKVDTNGIITTIAGNGSSGYSGDGGPAANAQLWAPTSIVVDASPNRNIYFSDSANNRVRMLATASAFSVGSADGDIFFTEDNGLGHIISSKGLHQKTIDLNNGVALRTFDYNENNRLTSIIDLFSNEINLEQSGNNVPTAIISPDGLRTEFTVDANNHLSRITYPDGSFYEFEYTSDGLMTAEIDPEGNRFEHDFDEIGRVTDVYDEEGGHWNYNRNADLKGDILSEVTTGEGNVTTYLDHTDSTGAYTSTITGPTGAETSYSQSADGLTVNKGLPCGMELDFKYDLDSEYLYKYVKEMTATTPVGLDTTTLRDKTYEDTDADEIPDLITETVTVNGKATTLVQNTLTAQKTITSPVGRVITAEYDPDTLLTSSVSMTGLYDTTYEYYPAVHQHYGRLQFVRAGTRETEFTYDAQGNLYTVEDPEGNVTTYEEYDEVGRLKTVLRPDTTRVRFDYDKNGNMTVLTNPSSIDHGFGYNKVNLNDAYQTPISGSYSYIYDNDRRITQKNFPSGQSIVWDYVNPDDSNDKSMLWQIQTPDGNIDYTYSCGNKIESLTKGTESITYSYDGSLRTSEIRAGTLNETIAYTYDADGDFELDGLTYAGGTADYVYDDDNLLTGSGDFTITRNAGNGLPESVSGGSLSLSRSFSQYGELDGQDSVVNSTSLNSWTLTRDDNGRIETKTETVDGVTVNYVYGYNSMGRLTSVTKDGAVVEEYDYGNVPYGTCTYQVNTLRGISRTLGYDDEDHLLSTDTATYDYDLDGFLTTKTEGSDVTTYDYSVRGELLSVGLPDGRVIEYEHDPLGRRIAKKIDGTVVEKYLWQGLTRLLAIYDASNTLVMRFEYADIRMPVAMTKGGATYYLSYDQVGSLRIVADASGNVVKQINYDSFGYILNDSDSAFELPFGFAGGLYDVDTGLVRFGLRDYDSDVGRWTAKDPILFAGGDTDLYGYVLNDPVNFVDPEGLIVVNAGAAAVGAIGGAIVNGAYAYMRGESVLSGALVGAGAGLIAGFTMNPFLAGAIIGTANTAGNIAVGIDNPCNVGVALLRGAAFGFVGGGIGGHIGETLSYNAPQLGAALGEVIGSNTLNVGDAAIDMFQNW